MANHRESPDEVDPLGATLAEQQAYYRARAPEYDQWFLRQGRYDQGPELNQRWFDEVGVIRAALEAARITGDVLEMAAGTGWWTERLASSAEHVTALDSSPEALEIARQRLRAAEVVDRVTFVTADLFAWRPDRAYDAVFFGFWVSHIPDDRLNDFIATVAEALRPGGTVFWVDNRREQTGTAADQPLPEGDNQIMTRRLNDGRTFQVVKRFRSAADYEAAFAAFGIELTVCETATYFQYATGRKRG